MRLINNIPIRILPNTIVNKGICSYTETLFPNPDEKLNQLRLIRSFHVIEIRDRFSPISRHSSGEHFNPMSWGLIRN